MGCLLLLRKLVCSFFLLGGLFSFEVGLKCCALSQVKEDRSILSRAFFESLDRFCDAWAKRTDVNASSQGEYLEQLVCQHHFRRRLEVVGRETCRV